MINKRLVAWWLVFPMALGLTDTWLRAIHSDDGDPILNAAFGAVCWVLWYVWDGLRNGWS
jgi:hypothetical protein